MNIEHLQRMRDILADPTSLVTSEFEYLREYSFAMGTELLIEDDIATSGWRVQGCVIGLAFLLGCADEGLDIMTVERIVHGDPLNYARIQQQYLDMSADNIHILGYPLLPFKVYYGDIDATRASTVLTTIINSVQQGGLDHATSLDIIRAAWLGAVHDLGQPTLEPA